MQFNEYIEFTRLCRKYDPAVELDYLIAGLISEVGEVVGVEAKYIRGDYDKETYLSRLQSELGDVAWMFFRLIDTVYVENGLDTVENVLDTLTLPQLSYLFRNSNAVVDTGLDLISRIANYSLFRTGDVDNKLVVKQTFMFMYSHITILCYLAETTLEEVISKNVTKLKERLLANTIKGDGEHR